MEDTYLTTVEVRFALLIGVVSNRKTPYVRYIDLDFQKLLILAHTALSNTRAIFCKAVTASWRDMGSLLGEAEA